MGYVHNIIVYYHSLWFCVERLLSYTFGVEFTYNSVHLMFEYTQQHVEEIMAMKKLQHYYDEKSTN